MPFNRYFKEWFLKLRDNYTCVTLSSWTGGQNATEACSLCVVSAPAQFLDPVTRKDHLLFVATPWTSLTLDAALECPEASSTCSVIDPNNETVLNQIVVWQNHYSSLKPYRNLLLWQFDDNVQKSSHVPCFEMIVGFSFIIIYSLFTHDMAVRRHSF